MKTRAALHLSLVDSIKHISLRLRAERREQIEFDVGSAFQSSITIPSSSSMVVVVKIESGGLSHTGSCSAEQYPPSFTNPPVISSKSEIGLQMQLSRRN